MKQFYVGIKCVIHDERGVLLLKSSGGYWDFPGGRMDEGEEFVDTALRELSEELPGTRLDTLGELLGAYRIPRNIKEDTGLVLLFFMASVTLPNELTLSDEHTEILFVKNALEIPKDGMNEKIREILHTLLPNS